MYLVYMKLRCTNLRSVSEDMMVEMGVVTGRDSALKSKSNASRFSAAAGHGFCCCGRKDHYCHAFTFLVLYFSRFLHCTRKCTYLPGHLSW